LKEIRKGDKGRRDKKGDKGRRDKKGGHREKR
jgi:hypothetical protein